MGVVGTDIPLLALGVALDVRTCTKGSLSEYLDGVLIDMSCLLTAGLTATPCTGVCAGVALAVGVSPTHDLPGVRCVLLTLLCCFCGVANGVATGVLNNDPEESEGDFPATGDVGDTALLRLPGV